MTGTHQVVYVAANRGQAHALANLLLSHGVSAHVSNDFSGGDLYVGDPSSHSTAPSVIVHQHDAERARQIIEDAELAIEQGVSSPELAKLEAEAVEDEHWPACPHCNRPRLATCPVCETAGTHFTEAFMPERVLDGDHADDRAESLLVICPTCDEPFAPDFPARCEWCGHRFEDGHEPPPTDLYATPPFLSPETTGRVGMLLLGLILLIAAVFGWFYYVLY